MRASGTAEQPKQHAATKGEKLVIGASSLGTVFEWYDFYLYGALLSVITKHFFSGVNETTGFIFALAAFAAGFAVRPFGALVFGRIGDIVGRKNTFLVTMAIMGLSTFLIGCLPTYGQIGVAAPVMLIALRLLQGLALGGEYGGAATYVAEHAPNHKRGLYTSWIQTTATLGLLLSLVVIMLVRRQFSLEIFDAWAWRIPFLASIVLLGVSLWIRLQLAESPVFQKLKDEGATSRAPLKEAFGRWRNLKLVLIALFGAVAGQAVVWYAGQFYALFFLERVLKVEALTTNVMVAIALVIGTPFFLVFGWLSDKIGRKPLILAGCALAALTYFPLFSALTEAANPALAQAQRTAPVIVRADPASCSLQFDPIGRNRFDRSSCDLVKNFLSKAGVSYDNEAAEPGAAAEIRIGGEVLAAPHPRTAQGEVRTEAIAQFQSQMRAALDAPSSAENRQTSHCRYDRAATSRCSGCARGKAPPASPRSAHRPSSHRSATAPEWRRQAAGSPVPDRRKRDSPAFAIVAASGNIYSGLWYPVIVASLTVLIGLFWLPETRKRDINT